MYRAVVDTNLIISGTASVNSVPYHLLEAWRQEKYIVVTSVPILAEVKEVLAREEIQSHFHLTSNQAKEVIDTLSTQAAAAIEGNASFIISGDKHLLDIEEYEGIKIIKARDFLENILHIDISKL